MRTDLLLDENFDLQEDPVSFDFVEGQSDDQHVMLLLITEKGENREYPFAGFGMRSRLRSRVNIQQYLRDMEVELSVDGYDNAKITLNKDLTPFQIEV